MEYVISLLAELAAVAAVVSGIQFAVLAFRNPHRPSWTRIGFVESAAVMAIVAGLTFSVAMLVTGLIGAGMHVFAAVIGGVCFPLAVGLANGWIFGIRERLRRADAGQSPFGVTPDADASGRTVAG